MKSKTALALIVFLCLCIGFVAVRKLISTASKEPTAQQPVSLFPSAPQEIKQVVIEPADAPKMTFAKDKTDWRLVEPIHAKAVASLVTAVARSLTDLTSERSFAPSDKDAVKSEITGLDKPLWTVTVAGDGGQALVLQVGKPVPLSRGQTYVRPKGDARTYVVAEDFAAKLSKPLHDYRDKTVLTLVAAEVNRLQATGRELPIAYDLMRHDDTWGMAKPVNAKADANAVKEIIGKIAYLSAADFVADEPKNLSPYGLEQGKERMVLRVWLKPPAPASQGAQAASAPSPASQPGEPAKSYAVAFGDRTEDKVYAKLLGEGASPEPAERAVFRLPASLLDDIQKKLADVRDRTIIDVDVAAVTAIDLKGPEGSGSLVKTDGLWHMTKPQAGLASDKAVRALLDKIAALRALSWVDDKTASFTGLATPVDEITLHLSGKSDAVTFQIGSAGEANETYVTSAASPYACLVKTSDLQTVGAAPAAYWDPAILTIPFEQRFQSVTLNRPDGNFTVEQDAGDAWKLTAPIASAANTSQVFKMMGGLSSLNADKVVYLGSQVPPKYAAAENKIVVDIRAQSRQQAPAAGSEPAPTASTGPASAPAASTLPATNPTTAASSPATASAPASQPAAVLVNKEYRLTVVKVDGKSYAWVADANAAAAVGEFPASLYDDLAGELRDCQVWTLDTKEVVAVKIVNGDDKLELRKEKNDWVNAADPYAKINSASVTAFLNDLKDLKADKFVSYHSNPADAEKYSLKTPAVTVELKLAGDKTLSLAVSAKGPAAKAAEAGKAPDATKGAEPSKTSEAAEGRWASSPSLEGVFVLSGADVAKVSKKLADFTGATPTPPAGRNAMPRGMEMPQE